jgi:MFS family permease
MSSAAASASAPDTSVRSVCSVVAVLALGGTVPAPLYLIWQGRMHFSEIVLTLIFGIYFMAAVLALLFFGRLSDQIGRRSVLLLGIVVAVASTLCLIFARGLPLLFIGRFLSGFSVGLVLSAFTSYLSELFQGEDAQSRASDLSAIVELLGLGAGPPLAGVMAQYLSLPTLACFYVLLFLLVAVAIPGSAARETVRERQPFSMRPQLAAPGDKKAAFLSLAATGFCMFAMIGLFTSLVPSVLSERLHNTNHAIAGAIVFELFLVAAVAVRALRRLSERVAIAASLVLIPLGLVLLMLGIMRPSPWFFVAGTAVEGLAIGQGFANTLRAVNQLVESADRARVLSLYFVVTYTAAMLPVVGMGLITQYTNPIAADFTFACIIGLLAITALAARLSGLSAS